jgi:hypothetical protein
MGAVSRAPRVGTPIAPASMTAPTGAAPENGARCSTADQGKLSSEVITMTSIIPEQPVDDKLEPTAELESDIRRLVREGVAPSPQPDTEPSDSDVAARANGFIDRISAGSAKEIASLIAELQHLRDFLLAEGDRMQREISGYVHLNEGVVKATKIIAEAIPRWRISGLPPAPAPSEGASTVRPSGLGRQERTAP